VNKEKIGILIGEASTLFGFYGDSFDSKRAKEITDEISNEFAELEGQNEKALEVLDYYANGSWDIGKRAREFIEANNKGNL
jgi:hypothetical protein